MREQRAYPWEQGGPGPRGDARGRDGGPPREGKAGTENKPNLRNEGADYQPGPGRLGGMGRRAKIVESRRECVQRSPVDVQPGQEPRTA